ncbi:hypothetical protein DFH09DRAFT_1085837 [Mycena vulgaris]|nr:hypothetical protein DFH09DRAFT_1085837 [Mycena vulgaris]
MSSQENQNAPIQLIFREGDVRLILHLELELTTYRQRTELIDLGSRYIALAKEIRELREAHQKKVVEHKEATKKLRLNYEAKYQAFWDRHQLLRTKHEHLITHVDHCPHVRIVRPAPIASRNFVADIPEDIIERDNDRPDNCHVDPELQKKVYLKARKIVRACAMPNPTEDYNDSDEENTILKSEHANEAESGRTELANHKCSNRASIHLPYVTTHRRTNHKVNTVQQTTNTTGASWVRRTSPQIARTQSCGSARNVTLSAVRVIEYKAIGNRYM